MVWAGVWSGGRVGPFFFDESVSAEIYLNLLNEKVWPRIFRSVRREELWFQQDGAPAHFARTVRDWLNRHFPNRWIGRQSEFYWPPRSPDLTVSDFFLWGYLKDKVYRWQPNNITTLKLYIEQEFNKIPQQMIKKSCLSVIDRLKHCIQHNGDIVYTKYHLGELLSNGNKISYENNYFQHFLWNWIFHLIENKNF
jgi:hypothetical protein